MAQAGERRRPTKRWSSWYDPALVTKAGEDILAELDSWAARELRRLQMTWSSWQGKWQLDADTIRADDHRGVRVVSIDGKKLRLFLLSILWRSAETSLTEFNQVVINEGDRELLRKSILRQISPPPDLFPIGLTQLTTIGPRHNMSPISDVKIVPRIDPFPPEEFPIFRFFFDGLIVHFHRGCSAGAAARFGPFMVGADERLIITTVSFESSWQLENMLALVGDSEKLFLKKLYAA